jgi:hypothetical protein
MAYAYDPVELTRRVANDIDAILRCTNPATSHFAKARSRAGCQP